MALCLLVTALFGFLELAPLNRWNAPLKDSEDYLQDYFAVHGRMTLVNTNIVLIGIDQPSYEGVIFPEDVVNDPVLAALRERYPWSRRVWAALIDRLAAAAASRKRGSLSIVPLD